ncbi:MAG: AraC family transcriptional regulator [Pseudomonadota bacterium]
MLSEGGHTGLEPPRVLASAATGVIDLIQRHGGDVDTVFGRANISTDDIEDPFNDLNLQRYCQLFVEAAGHTGHDNFGLQFGDQFMPKQLGALGYAAICSPTLSAALRNMEKYFPAHQGQTSFGLLQDSDILWLSYRIYDPRIKDRRQDAELSLGMFRNIFRAALGPDWAPLEVRFEHDKPEDWHEHEQRFGAPVRFGRRTNALAFRRRDLDARMPEQDPYLFSVIERFLTARCELRGNPEDFATVVRNQIKLHLGDRTPGLTEIAEVLGMTDAKFQRALKNHGLTFQDLLRAARQELALHYMNDASMPLTEVALSLGYSELSAFSRAFRNWTGMSPQRYQRTAR